MHQKFHLHQQTLMALSSLKMLASPYFYYLDSRVFPRMVRPLRYSPIHLSLEEVTVHAGHNVLMEVDNKISLIIGDPRGIIDQQVRPHAIHLLNIIITLMNCFILYIIK
jgi:hypothetical protein